MCVYTYIYIYIYICGLGRWVGVRVQLMVSELQDTALEGIQVFERWLLLPRTPQCAALCLAWEGGKGCEQFPPSPWAHL